MAEDFDLRHDRRVPPRGAVWLLAVLGTVTLVAGVLFVQRGLAGRTSDVTAERTATAAAGVLAPIGTVAYVSRGQVIIARPGAAPRQLTHFARPDRDPRDWGPLVWSPDARSVAVAIGSPLVDANQIAGAAGSLYVIAVRTGNATLLTPRSAGAPGVTVGPQTYAWQSASRLLFVVAGKVFTYDATSDTVTPLAGFSRTTVLDLAVRGQALYYSSYVAAAGPLSALPDVLRRFDLITHVDTQVADLGTTLLQVTGCDVTGCMPAAGVAATLPAWDVSPGETAVAYERVTGLSADRTQAHISFYVAARLSPPTVTTPSTKVPSLFGASSAIFAGVAEETPAGAPNACCYLRFSPDGRALVLTSGYAMPTRFGPYLLYPQLPHTTYQTGFPWAFGPAAWRPDSRAFSMTSHRGSAPTTTLLTYGDETTQALANDAYDAAYAPVVK